VLRFISVVFTIIATMIGSTVAQPKDTIFYQDVSWSPDGTKLLLSRLDIKGNDYRYHVYSVNTDGSNYLKVTDGPDDCWTSWSPDGSRFVYASKKDGNTDILVRGFDSVAAMHLTSDTARDSHPDWSPDGKNIAFVSRKNGLSQVYVTDSNGKNPHMLTTDSVQKGNPRWSPNGKRIAYYGNIEAGHDSIYIISANGENKLTICEGVWPSWSPDGKSILFTFDHDIYQIKLGDTVKTKLIDNAYFATSSPDGKKIAFIKQTWKAESGWPAASAVFISNSDGTGQSRIVPKSTYLGPSEF